MWKCKKCKEYRFSAVRECHCKEFMIIDEDGDEHSLYAMDSEGAALRFAEESNVSGDYYLMDNSVVIEVDGEKFVISAEPDVHYSADSVD